MTQNMRDTFTDPWIPNFIRDDPNKCIRRDIKNANSFTFLCIEMLDFENERQLTLNRIFFSSKCVQTGHSVCAKHFLDSPHMQKWQKVEEQYWHGVNPISFKFCKIKYKI